VHTDTTRSERAAARPSQATNAVSVANARTPNPPGTSSVPISPDSGSRPSGTIRSPLSAVTGPAVAATRLTR
jgi:hypothetical protein